MLVLKNMISVTWDNFRKGEKSVQNRERGGGVGGWSTVYRLRFRHREGDKKVLWLLLPASMPISLRELVAFTSAMETGKAQTTLFRVVFFRVRHSCSVIFFLWKKSWRGIKCILACHHSAWRALSGAFIPVIDFNTNNKYHLKEEARVMANWGFNTDTDILLKISEFKGTIYLGLV